MAGLNLGNERVRLTILLAVLAVVSVVMIVQFLRGGSIVGLASDSKELDYVARNLPPLQIDGIGHEAGGDANSEGNPFAFRPPPTPTPNLTPPPTAVPRPTMPPRPTPTPRISLGADGQPKPPPPPFDREYIGYLGPAPIQVAAFRKSDADSTEIEVAVVGDILDNIFIVREIGLESVVIGFVDYDPSEDTRVPLAEK
jgi:hypothetical protein